MKLTDISLDLEELWKLSHFGYRELTKFGNLSVLHTVSPIIGVIFSSLSLRMLRNRGNQENYHTVRWLVSGRAEIWTQKYETLKSMGLREVTPPQRQGRWDLRRSAKSGSRHNSVQLSPGFVTNLMSSGIQQRAPSPDVRPHYRLFTLHSSLFPALNNHPLLPSNFHDGNVEGGLLPEAQRSEGLWEIAPRPSGGQRVWFTEVDEKMKRMIVAIIWAEQM